MHVFCLVCVLVLLLPYSCSSDRILKVNVSDRNLIYIYFFFLIVLLLEELSWSMGPSRAVVYRGCGSKSRSRNIVFSQLKSLTLSCLSSHPRREESLADFLYNTLLFLTHCSLLCIVTSTVYEWSADQRPLPSWKSFENLLPCLLNVGRCFFFFF